jgi:hypothetical protein
MSMELMTLALLQYINLWMIFHVTHTVPVKSYLRVLRPSREDNRKSANFPKSYSCMSVVAEVT